MATIESRVHMFESAATQGVASYILQFNRTVTITMLLQQYIHHIYTTTRNHNYLLVYKGVDAGMHDNKNNYLSSCTNMYNQKLKC